MSVLVLKVIAVLSMLLDHIGLVAGSTALRCAGRLAFPIYAFLIGNGLRHTSSPERYLRRLLILAAVSQLPYTLCLFHTLQPIQLNIFCTLALGLAILWALRQDAKKAAAGLLLFTLGLDWLVGLDYGTAGVLWIVALGLCEPGLPHRRSILAALVALFALWPLADGLLSGQGVVAGWWINLFMLAALPLLLTYQDTLGYPRHGRFSRLIQLAFYWFYPVHLLLLWLLWP